ncbi:hypothetical protein L1887_48389 [Cichorium endivia]|nr:hypothetical protein L1887_48389 [Cichorium endivia]
MTSAAAETLLLSSQTIEPGGEDASMSSRPATEVSRFCRRVGRFGSRLDFVQARRRPKGCLRGMPNIALPLQRQAGLHLSGSSAAAGHHHAATRQHRLLPDKPTLCCSANSVVDPRCLRLKIPPVAISPLLSSPFDSAHEDRKQSQAFSKEG